MKDYSVKLNELITLSQELETYVNEMDSANMRDNNNVLKNRFKHTTNEVQKKTRDLLEFSHGWQAYQVSTQSEYVSTFCLTLC